MRRLTLLAVALVAAIQPLSGFAKPVPVLARTGKWVVSFDPDSCSVAGTFGADAEQITMQLTWYQPSDAFQFKLIGKPLLKAFTSSAVDLTFGPGSATQHTRSINGTSGDLPMIIVSSTRLHYLDEKSADEDIPKTTAEQEKAVEWLDLRVDGLHRRLALQTMGPVMAVVRSCTRDLVKSWGFDPAVQETLSREPKATSSPGAWINSSDYPSAALGRGKMGLVRFRLNVDPAGKVSSCQILKGIQSPEFDKLTCDLLSRRARLEPGLDAGGKPVATFYVNTVYWTLDGA